MQIPEKGDCHLFSGFKVVSDCMIKSCFGECPLLRQKSRSPGISHGQAAFVYPGIDYPRPLSYYTHPVTQQEQDPFGKQRDTPLYREPEGGAEANHKNDYSDFRDTSHDSNVRFREVEIQ